MRLVNWSVRADPYKAPEQCGSWLTGEVFGRDGVEDGTRISTSELASAAGRVVTTRSGSLYRLGRVCPKYRAFLRERGIKYARRQPVSVRVRT